ncbi:MAG TPA: hypothetical protein VLG48_00630 [Candidatus Methylomirabilis sp.]|nr:hypothetical protein [Candidatus Methylomirabilis sp.]
MRRVLVSVLGIALLTTSCFTLEYSSSASSKPISFTGEKKGQRTPFTQGKWIWYAFWGLAPLSDNDIEKSLIDHRTAGGAVQGLSIKSEITLPNGLVNLFTCPLSFCSQTVTVEGDIVR